jgi:hypothetical protein
VVCFRKHGNETPSTKKEGKFLMSWTTSDVSSFGYVDVI